MIHHPIFLIGGVFATIGLLIAAALGRRIDVKRLGTRPSHLPDGLSESEYWVRRQRRKNRVGDIIVAILMLVTIVGSVLLTLR